jgi:hypothetical protein
MGTKVNKKTQIIIPFGMRKEIANELNICTTTVYHALKGNTNSNLADICRDLAISKLKKNIQE